MSVRTLIDNGSDNRVEIVFVGDGYTSSELSTYTSHVSDFCDYMFSTGETNAEPFVRYRNYFNVHLVDVASTESGADNPHTNDGGVGAVTRNTALGAAYYYRGYADERLLYINDSAADTQVTKALSGTGITADMKFCVVNDDTYGGGGGKYAVFAGANDAAYEVALHEMGHSFAKLADEYGYSKPTYTGSEPTAANVTKSSSGTKWSEWLGYQEDWMSAPIGAYAGGLYADDGIYHPSSSSKMLTLGVPFDAVSREQFVLAFYKLVDPLDAWTSNSGTLLAPEEIWVDTIDDEIIKLEWKVDGVAVDTTDDTYDLDNLSLGAHTVSVRAYDDTDWVRGETDRKQLEETVTWKIVVAGGTAADETISSSGMFAGRGGNDTLTGGTGADTLLGGSGSDVLDGGAGNDSLVGGDGNDVFRIDSAKDAVSDSGGYDVIETTLATFSLARLSAIEALCYIGSGSFNGTGGNGNESIEGGSGNDKLNGGKGNDTLVGGSGADALTGGAGNDLFMLGLAGGADQIIDFAAGDKLGIDASSLSAGTGTLDAAFFALDAAGDTDDYFVYNKGQRTLYYDADGSGTDDVAVAIAVFKKPLTLAAADIVVI